MAQQLKGFVALAEDLCLVPSTHIVPHNCLLIDPEDCNALHWPPGAPI